MATEWMGGLEPLVSALGRTLVDFVWQGVLIAAAYAIARAILRAPRARLFAGQVALLSLAFAPLLTLSAQLSAPQPSVATVLAGDYVPQAIQIVVGDSFDADLTRWQYWLVAAWAAGVAVLSLRLWTQWRRLRRLCRQSLPVDAAWQARFAELKRRLGVRWRVSLRVGAQVAAPMLVGVLRPTILLPAALMARLPVDQMELVLLHELAHLRRFDPLLNLIQTAIVTVLFYHPAVHWISRKVDEDRELCCDDDVVAAGGDRLRYARVLLTLAEEEWPGAPATALAASGGALLQRVEHIVEAPPSRGVNAQGIVLLVLATALVLVWWLPGRERQLPQWMAPVVSLLPDTVARLPVPEFLVPEIDRPSRLQLQPLAASAEPDVASVAMPLAAPLRLEPLPLERVAPELDFTPAALPRLPETVVEAAVQPTPRYRVEPSYPQEARERGEQGWVELSYRVSADGGVEDIALDASGAGVAFERAARAALRQWRFAPADSDGRLLRVRFDFVMTDSAGRAISTGSSDAIASQAADTDAARCRPRTGTRLCSDLRDSVREVRVGSANP